MRIVYECVKSIPEELIHFLRMNDFLSQLQIFEDYQKFNDIQCNFIHKIHYSLSSNKLLI